MPNSTDNATLAKSPPGAPASPGPTSHTLPVEWAVVALGGTLLLGNTAELGGVGAAAQEWTAFVLAAMVVIHGACLAWPRGAEEDAAGVRLPRWPLAALPLLFWVGCGWWRNTDAPWLARDTFFLFAEAWLIGWMVAATPGGRVVSWVWLGLLAAAGVVAFVAAASNQRGENGLWLPFGRELPQEWLGRWTGTLPTPGAFGGLMLLGSAPALVLAFSRRLPPLIRFIFGYAGAMLLLGSVFSDSLGVWLGVVGMVVGLPLVVSPSVNWRLAIWGPAVLAVGGVFLWSLLTPGAVANPTNWLLQTQAGELDFGESLAVLKHAWGSHAWLGGQGRPFAVLSTAAGLAGPAGGGWAYGFGDWWDLATQWGTIGTALGVLALGGLLAAGYKSWRKIPLHIIAAKVRGKVRRQVGMPESQTPATKVLLGAAGLGLGMFAVAMLGTRALNVPAVAFAFAVLAGVLARNVPQRGGSLRLEPANRWVACLGPALIVAALLAWKVAPAARAAGKIADAMHRIEAVAGNPAVLKRYPKMTAEAEAQLAAARASDPANAQILLATAWLRLDESNLDPVKFESFSRAAERAAHDALETAKRSPEANIVLAVACTLRNQLPRAEVHALQALDLAPENPRVVYYAVAILELSADNRADAARLVQQARKAGWPVPLVRKIEGAATWAKEQTVPADGALRQRPLPPYFTPPEAWPPLNGLAAGAQQSASKTRNATPPATGNLTAGNITPKTPGAQAPAAAPGASSAAP